MDYSPKPNHPMTQLYLYLYTLDTWLFQELNKGSREGDTTKIDTLGPYAFALMKIIKNAANNRTDITELKKKLEIEGVELFRAGGFEEEKIQQFKKYVHKKEVRNVYVQDPETGEKSWEDQKLPALIPLIGFVSTSLDKQAAEEFTWSNPDAGIEATLFKIHFKCEINYYVMDMSALPQELEILLEDGAKFEVVSVEKTQDQYGEPINLITLKHERYDCNLYGWRDKLKKKLK